MALNLLAVDIGGTSSRFAHFAVESRSLQLIGSTWLKTGDAKSFPELLDLLAQTDFSLFPAKADFCSFAVAGPVRNGNFCTPPNIAWDVDLRRAESQFGIKRFALLNDFLAQACACVSPIAETALPIIPGEPVTEGAIAVIGAGTGLGKAFLLADGMGGYFGASSEGGHAGFPIQGAKEFEFQEFCCKLTGGYYITCEEVVSGIGLSRIHEFLTGNRLEPKDVAATFSPDSETLRWAARFYGRVCRNFALDTLSVGGLFLAGGVAAKNPQLVAHEEFKKSFHDSSVHAEVLKKIPVRMLDNMESGLWGAAYFGMQKLAQKH